MVIPDHGPLNLQQQATISNNKLNSQSSSMDNQLREQVVAAAVATLS